MADSFTAAVVQAAPVMFDQYATIEKLKLLSLEAKSKGASLTVFPEAFISAYPRGLDFGSRIGSRSLSGRKLFKKYFESAIEVPGQETAAIGSIAADQNMFIVVGVIERELGTLYCAVLFFSNEGVLLGKHRKVMPTGLERLIWGSGDGSTLPVFDTTIGKLGAAICWENYMPLLRTALYSKGIELYCAPTADGRPTWIPTVRHIALEGRCFVFSSNQFVQLSDYPLDYGAPPNDELDNLISPGGSCIVGPLGDILAGPNYDSECVLTATINIEAITESKLDFDPVGHYSRPDIFSLHVNERMTSSVVVRKDTNVCDDSSPTQSES